MIICCDVERPDSTDVQHWRQGDAWLRCISPAVGTVEFDFHDEPWDILKGAKAAT